MNNSNAAVQALNTGGTLTDTFTVATIDGTQQVVTVTVNGANDAAVVSGTSTGSVAEAGGVSNATPGTPTTTGTLTDADVDNTGNTFAVVAAATASTGGYGTYTIDAGGNWSYSVNNSNATVQALNAGDTLTDTFTVATTDGTQKVVTVTVNGANDAAVVSGTSTGSVTEASGVSNATPGTPTVIGTLTDTDIDNTGNTFAVVAAATGSTGGFGTYTIDASGHWSYSVNNSNATVQALNTGGTLTDTFTVATTDGTQQVVTITVRGANDAPVAAVLSAASATEGIAMAPVVIGAFSDIDNSASALTYSAALFDNSVLPSWLQFDALTRTFTGTPTAATQGDYLVKVTASDGALSTSDSFLLQVVIDGAVVAVTDLAAAVEAGGNSNTSEGVNPSGNVLTNDAGAGLVVISTSAGNTLASSPTTVTGAGVPVVGSYGTLRLSSTGAYTYVLDNANNTVQALNNGSKPLTDAFTYQAQSNGGTTSNANILVVISGVNDAAVLTGDMGGWVTEASGLNNATLGTPTVTGLLTDTDVDNTSNTFAVVASATASTGGFGTYTIDVNGNWSYSVNNSNATVQALNTGRTLTDTFTIATIDGTQQLVTITIAGANDSAVVGGATTGSVNEASGLNNSIVGTPTVTGTLTAADMDDTSNKFNAFAAPTTHGSFTVDADGHWSYTVDNNQLQVQALNIGDTLTDMFEVTTIDGTKQVVSVVVHGANDVSVIGGESTGQVTEASGALNMTVGTATAVGLLTSRDADNPDNAFIPVLTPTNSVNGYGSFVINDSGAWQYSIDDSNAAVQALTVGTSLTDTFVVRSIDGTAQTVTITLNGANDFAVISGQTSAAVIEAGGVNNAVAGHPSATGQLQAADVDNVANRFRAAAPAPSISGYGSFAVDALGAWRYQLDNSNPIVQSLNVGQLLADTFVVRSVDGTAQVVRIAIQGTDDAATVTGDLVASLIVPANDIVRGEVTALDPDNTANTFIAVVDPLPSQTGVGLFVVDVHGDWQYSLNLQFILDHAPEVALAIQSGQTFTDTFAIVTEGGTQQVITVTIAPPPSNVAKTGGGGAENSLIDRIAALTFTANSDETSAVEKPTDTTKTVADKTVNPLNVDAVEDEASALDDGGEETEQTAKADAAAEDAEVAQGEAIVASRSSSGVVAESMAQRVTTPASADTVGGWEAAATASKSDFSRATVNSALDSGPAQFAPGGTGGRVAALSLTQGTSIAGKPSLSEQIRLARDSVVVQRRAA